MTYVIHTAVWNFSASISEWQMFKKSTNVL